MSEKSTSAKNKELFSGMAIYAIGTFGTKLLSFLIVPLYTYYITTSDMGTYDLLHSAMSVLTPIVTLQISDAAYRWMIRKENIEGSIEATIQVLFINSVIFSGLILLFNLFIPIPFCHYFIGLLITSRALQTIQKLLRGLNNKKLFAISSILYSAIYLGLNVLQICVLQVGVVSLFLSQIISNILTIIFIVCLDRRLFRNYFKPINFPFVKELISVSAPLVPNLLNWWVMSSSDRFIISFAINSAANGIYAISCKFPSFLHLVLNLFTTSWQDLSIADKEKDGTYYSKVFEKLYIFSFTIIPVIIAATQLYIVLLMSPAYHEAARYVAFLYMGTIFQVFSSFYGVGYVREKKTKNASLTSIYGAIINFVVNIGLIYFIGLYAAAISTFAGFLVMWLIREHQNRDELQILIDKQKFVTYFTIACIFSSVSSIFNVYADFIFFALGAAYFLIVNRKDLKSILSSVTRKIHKKKVQKQHV